MSKELILLAGPYQVGKSYLARKLEEQIPNSIYLSFATGIREKLEKSLSIPRELLYKKPSLPYIRELLRGYGEYVKENIDINYWCLYLYGEFIISKKDILIIDDFRFIHELEFFKCFFEKVVIIYIANKSGDYDLEKIYNFATYKVNKYPDVNNILELIGKS